MTPRQVASAIRQQNRAQRIVSGNSYPRQAGRWLRRHPKVAGFIGAGVGAGVVAALAVPLLAVAGVGLGVYGVARHPAFRNAAFIAGRGASRHTARFGRWMRGQWDQLRRRRAARVPLDGELVDEPIKPQPRQDSEPVDAEVVEPPHGELPPGHRPSKPAAAPRATDPAGRDVADTSETMPHSTTADGLHIGVHRLNPALVDTQQVLDDEARRVAYEKAIAHRDYLNSLRERDLDRRRRRQKALANRPEPPQQPDNQEKNMRVWDTLTESVLDVAQLQLGPGEGGGHDVERWAESLADFFETFGSRISEDAQAICERFPMGSSSQESMAQLGGAMSGFASQVREHVEQWKADTSWQYTDNNS